MTRITTDSDMPLQVTSPFSAIKASSPDEIVLKLASEPAELTGAFELVYESYKRAGLSESNPFRLRVTTHQLLESSEILIAKLRDTVISTVSLIPDSPHGLPMEKEYGPEVAEFRRAGFRLAEVSCLADRRDSLERSMPMLLKLMAMVVQHSVIRSIDRLLIAVHPRHARYYKRLLGFQQVGAETQYGAVLDQPAVALFKDLNCPRSENTKVFNGFYDETFERHQLVRCFPRPDDYVRRMRDLAVDRDEEMKLATRRMNAESIRV